MPEWGDKMPPKNLLQVSQSFYLSIRIYGCQSNHQFDQSKKKINSCILSLVEIVTLSALSCERLNHLEHACMAKQN